MIYSFRCTNCEAERDFIVPLSWHDFLKESVFCSDCGYTVVQNISFRTSFVRSPFPKGYNEHISPDGAYVRDKKEAMDIAAENGLVSVYCENRC